MAHIEDTQPIEMFASRTWSGTSWHYPYIEAMTKEMRELREAVRVLAASVRSNANDKAVGQHWDAEVCDEVWANSIAAEAVRKAGN